MQLLVKVLNKKVRNCDTNKQTNTAIQSIIMEHKLVLHVRWFQKTPNKKAYLGQVLFLELVFGIINHMYMYHLLKISSSCNNVILLVNRMRVQEKRKQFPVALLKLQCKLVCSNLKHRIICFYCQISSKDMVHVQVCGSMCV